MGCAGCGTICENISMNHRVDIGADIVIRRSLGRCNTNPGGRLTAFPSEDFGESVGNAACGGRLGRLKV